MDAGATMAADNSVDHLSVPVVTFKAYIVLSVEPTYTVPSLPNTALADTAAQERTTVLTAAGTVSRRRTTRRGTERAAGMETQCGARTCGLGGELPEGAARCGVESVNVTICGTHHKHLRRGVRGSRGRARQRRLPNLGAAVISRDTARGCKKEQTRGRVKRPSGKWAARCSRVDSQRTRRKACDDANVVLAAVLAPFLARKHCIVAIIRRGNALG